MDPKNPNAATTAAPPSNGSFDATLQMGAPLQMTVKVHQGRNIKGTSGGKAEKLTTTVKISFPGFGPKESSPVSDSATPIFNLEHGFNMRLDDTFIDILLNQRIQVQLMECLPKEKQAPIGQSDIPIYPYFFTADESGKLPVNFRQWVPIWSGAAGNQRPGSGIASAELDVEIKLSRPIFDQDLHDESNVVSIHVDTLEFPPEDWNLKEGNEKDLSSNMYQYGLKFFIPIGEQDAKTVTLGNGIIMSGAELAKMTAVSRIVESKDKQYPNNRNLILWNEVIRCWLSPKSLELIRLMASKKQPSIHCEFTRALMPKFAHLASQVDLNSFRGRIGLELSSILNPKSSTLSNRFRLLRFPIESGNGYAALSFVNATDDGKSAKDDVYRGLDTSIGIEVILDKPLLGRKRFKTLTLNVSDFVPPRDIPDHVKRSKKLEKVSDAYKREIQRFARILVKKYQEDPTNTAFLHDRSRFVEYLAKQGTYDGLKRDMKTLIQKMIQEYREQNPLEIRTDKECIAQVYMKVMQDTNTAIHQLFHHGADGLVPFPDQADARLLIAENAELDGDFKLAHELHLDRIASDEDNVQYWYDYGLFCLRNGELEKGDTCLRESLSRDPNHYESILAYGAHLFNTGHMETAYFFFKKGLEINPRDSLGLLLMGLFYFMVEDEAEGQKYIDLASQIEASKSSSSKASSIFEPASEFLIRSGATNLAEQSVAQELLFSNGAISAQMHLARINYQRGAFEDALQILLKASARFSEDPDIWSFIGHIYYRQKRYAQARETYETLMSLPKTPRDLGLVYRRLGSAYLILADETNVELLKMAKTVFIKACQEAPSALTWLGVGKTCFLLKEFSDAEDAFTEANLLKNTDGTIWGYIALLCKEAGRTFEANQTIAQAIKMGVYDADVWWHLADRYYAEQDFKSAVKCVQQCLNIDRDHVRAKQLFVKFTETKGLNVELFEEIETISKEIQTNDSEQAVAERHKMVLPKNALFKGLATK